MEQTLQKLPPDKAGALAISMVNAGYLARRMGKNQAMLSMMINHTVNNGKPYVFNTDYAEAMSKAIRVVGEELLNVSVSRQPKTESECSYAFGDDPVAQVKALCKKIQKRYLVENVMGLTMGWSGHHFSDPVNVRTPLTDDDITRINDAIHVIALRLLSIVVEY